MANASPGIFQACMAWLTKASISFSKFAGMLKFSSGLMGWIFNFTPTRASKFMPILTLYNRIQLHKYAKSKILFRPPFYRTTRYCIIALFLYWHVQPFHG